MAGQVKMLTGGFVNVFVCDITSVLSKSRPQGSFGLSNVSLVALIFFTFYYINLYIPDLVVIIFEVLSFFDKGTGVTVYLVAACHSFYNSFLISFCCLGHFSFYENIF